MLDQREKQNLVDAGCTEHFVKDFSTLHTPREKVCCLRRYRKDLLTRLHQQQDKLGCLDYLIFKLEKQIKE